MNSTEIDNADPPNAAGLGSDADPEQVPPDTKAPARKEPSQDIARKAIADLWEGKVPPHLIYKEIRREIEKWCKPRGLRTPSIRTIRRVMGRR